MRESSIVPATTLTARLARRLRSLIGLTRISERGRGEPPAREGMGGDGI